MRQLAALQGDFQDYLLRGTQAITAELHGSARVPVATRLAIYGGAYRGRLAEALAANFPALAALLGADDFEVLAARYIATHDSAFFTIRYYGHELPQFLASHEDYAEVPVFGELARWEWAMAGVFDAADARQLTEADLGRFAPQQWAHLRFTLHPSVTQLALAWNVPQQWRALTGDGARPELSFSPDPVAWLLWRQGLHSYFRSLPPLEAQALQAIRDGWPFAEVCTLMCEELGEGAAPAQAAALLRGWVDSGVISGAA
jgi:Putative DNA-binding domain